VKLSRTERWILINQCRILEKLCSDEADYYAQISEALRWGYELHYSDDCPASNDILTEQECREVLDILDMYRSLTFSYRDLDDKSGVDSNDLKFPGFDGNNETKQLMYAEYYMGLDGGRYQELRRDDLNSHWPMLPKYRQMLTEWVESKDKRHLSKDDIIRITSV